MVGVEQSTMLAFLSSTCATCGTFWDAFHNVNNLNMPGGTRLVITENGSAFPDLVRPDGTVDVSVIARACSAMIG